ncbi:MULTISPECIES: DUF4023 family protein [Paenibacillus]|uniref:DUF4023 domain-containing protein n=1 Tax=Paenibacillus physcomitrellae TaxID=1619311 RepID=A0ABQ1FWQ2_9BACL|nr:MULTISPECIES: DUF4023 family protein [Paenibacillus]GGA32823.1 hypothetical protein GCM10010917_17360 [Paenibacillus physcomitrellae]
MDSTHEFVEKVRQHQKNQERNKKRGQGTPNAVLPTKRHGTNK